MGKGDLDIELPRELQDAIDNELSSVSSRDLAARVESLSRRYRFDSAGGSASARTGGPSGGGASREGPRGAGAFLQGQQDLAAYVASRFPATFAAVYAALIQVRDVRPAWYPDMLADIGAGPGTAMWAGATVWPGIGSFTLLEREGGMIALGRRMAELSSAESVRSAMWVKADVTGEWDVAAHDLVIAAYVLGELPEGRVPDVLRRMWAATSDAGTLVIVEPGTPARFQRIRQARDLLIGEGAHVIAPCPHDEACPMKGADWCHFAQRVSRTRLHKQVKSGELPYEDEKFSFVAVSRVPASRITGRIIRHPQVRPGHIHFEACTPAGLATAVVTRSDRERFRKARDAKWGSVLP